MGQCGVGRRVLAMFSHSREPELRSVLEPSVALTRVYWHCPPCGSLGLQSALHLTNAHTYDSMSLLIKIVAGFKAALGFDSAGKQNNEGPGRARCGSQTCADSRS